VITVGIKPASSSALSTPKWSTSSKQKNDAHKSTYFGEEKEKSHDVYETCSQNPNVAPPLRHSAVVPRFLAALRKNTVFSCGEMRGVSRR
jgi:hypothetical protein